MPNSHNLYNFSSIVDFVDDAIIAYASTPVAAGPCDFSCIQQVVGFVKALLGGRRFDRKQPAKGPLISFGGAFKKNLMHPSPAP